MLLADKEQVVADTKARARRSTTRARSVSSPPVLCLLFQVRLLNVQQLELDYHLSRCLTLGLQATLAAALTYNGIIEIDDAAVRGPMLRLGYYTVTYASTCILLVVAFLTTFCSVRGAGVAVAATADTFGGSGEEVRAARLRALVAWWLQWGSRCVVRVWLSSLFLKR